MILCRLGNKKKIAHKIIAHFPPHKIFIDVFFGAGGLFFQKPKSPYNIVNDLDSDVFNLFQVVMNQKEELEKAFYMMPIHSDLLDYWKKNEETEPIKKALRFLFLSNWQLYGKMGSLDIGCVSKKSFFSKLDLTFEFLYDVTLDNKDCIKFIKTSTADRVGKKEDFLIYCDPPYLGTTGNYSNSFTEQDSEDLFNALEQTKCKWAMSEFDNPFILAQAEKRGLNVHIIGERQNLKNRRVEILVTNYKKQKELFD